LEPDTPHNQDTISCSVTAFGNGEKFPEDQCHRNTRAVDLAFALALLRVLVANAES